MSKKPIKLRRDPLERLPKDALKHLSEDKRRELEAAAEEPRDGGPAFPTVFGHPQGMSLRDYFAGMALANGKICGGEPTYTTAKNAYAYADAMLAERGDA
jgi:hypothetical protein